MEPSRNVLEPVRQDEEFILYRGQLANKAGSSPVLLLAPASAHPAVATQKKLEHEFSLRDGLDSAWAVRPLDLSQQGGQMTLVLEDPGGDTLDRLLRGPMGVTQSLRVAVGLAAALAGFDKREFIHKDVKPANVLVNATTGEARLMGFGIASRVPRERQAPAPPEFIAGTQFVHDRVQEAAYSPIPERLRAEMHLRIGRLLASDTPPDKREERIFEIVNQLNRGAALMTAREERAAGRSQPDRGQARQGV